MKERKARNTSEIIGDDIQETIAMSISHEGSRYLMSSLTNLYTEPLYAIVREYTSNAYDSHVKSGQTEPVRLSITKVEPYSEQYVTSNVDDIYRIIVEDSGEGMSRTDITEIYSQYGSSSKRDNNKEIGAFGLGAKSALSLCRKFDVTAVKNGLKTVAVVRFNKLDVPVIDIISETKTRDKSGVKIIIDVSIKNFTEFTERMKTFFAAWKPGTIIVNGVQPYTIYEDDNFRPVYGLQNTIQGWMRQTPIKQGQITLPPISVFIGPVLYTLPASKLKDDLHYRELFFVNALTKSIVINAPIGSLDLTPPREGVAFTDRSIRNLQTIYTSFVEELMENYQTDMDAMEAKDAASFAISNFCNLAGFIAHLNYPDRVATYEQVYDAPMLWRGHNMNLTYDLRKNGYTNSFLHRGSAYKTEKSEIKLLMGESLNKESLTYIRLPQNMKTDSWVKSNLLDYMRGTKNVDPANSWALVTTPTRTATHDEKTNPDNPSFWFNAIFEEITKEHFLAVARTYRKSIQTENKVVNVEYVVMNSTDKTMFSQIPSKIKSAPIIFDADDKLFNSGAMYNELRMLKKDQGCVSLNNRYSNVLFSALKALSYPTNDIVYLNGKSRSQAAKVMTDSIFMTDVLHNVYTQYSERDKGFIRMWTQIILSKENQNFEKLQKVCVMLKKDGKLDSLLNPYIHDFVEFMSDNLHSPEWAAKALIASNLNTHTVNNPLILRQLNDYSCYPMNIVPFLFSGIYHETQTIDYLNSIQVNETTSVENKFSLLILGTNNETMKIASNTMSAQCNTWDTY